MPEEGEEQMARAETIFSTPMGADQVNPSLESLCDLVLHGGDDFWAAGSGQAALEVAGEEGGRMLLMGLDAAGFFLVHESKTGSSCSRNPAAAPHSKQIVEIQVGGEPMQVPRENFVDKELACRSLQTFCATRSAVARLSGTSGCSLTPCRRRSEVIVEAMMRKALQDRIGFAAPQPFVEVATKFAERAGDIAKGLDLLEDALQLRLCHFLESRYETTPIEFFPFLATGGDGHHFGYVMHAPELQLDDYPMGSIVAGENDGVVFAGDTTLGALENMISYMRNRAEGLAEIDLHWLSTVGLHPDQAKAQDARRLNGDAYARPSPRIPAGWRHLMTSDGVGVVACESEFNRAGAEPLSRDSPVDRYLAAADAEVAAGYHGSALWYLKEAWWWAYFAPEQGARPIKLGLVRAYEKLGKTLLADIMTKYYTWLT